MISPVSPKLKGFLSIIVKPKIIFAVLAVGLSSSSSDPATIFPSIAIEKIPPS